MDLKIAAHRALAKKIADAEKDARELLASGAKVEREVKALAEASRTISTRIAGLQEHADAEKAAAEKTADKPKK